MYLIEDLKSIENGIIILLWFVYPIKRPSELIPSERRVSARHKGRIVQKFRPKYSRGNSAADVGVRVPQRPLCETSLCIKADDNPAGDDASRACDALVLS